MYGTFKCNFYINCMNNLEKTDKNTMVSSANPENWNIYLRSLFPLVPLVGSSASTIIEGKITDKKFENLYKFLGEVHSIDPSLIEDGKIDEQILSASLRKSFETHDDWKPRVFARIAAFSKVGDHDFMSAYFLDLIDSLSNHDLLTLLRMTPEGLGILTEEFKEDLNYSIATATHDAIRQVSLRKIAEFGLTDGDQPPNLTPLGREFMNLMY